MRSTLAILTGFSCFRYTNWDSFCPKGAAAWVETKHPQIFSKEKRGVKFERTHRQVTGHDTWPSKFSWEHDHLDLHAPETGSRFWPQDVQHV